MSTVDVKVKIDRTVQLNQFEPLTITLEESRPGVEVRETAEVRSKLARKLMKEADLLIQDAIEKYRES